MILKIHSPALAQDSALVGVAGMGIFLYFPSDPGIIIDHSDPD